MKICEFCGETFLAEGRSDQKYCSHNCGKRAWDKKQADLKKSIVETTKCDYCGNKIEITRNDRRWCSNECKIEAYKACKRKNNAKRHKENPNICDHCRKTFIPRRHINERFCSQECHDEFHRIEAIKQRDEQRAKVKKICPTCDKEFTPKKTLKEKYCSKRCRELVGKKVYKMMQTCYNAIGTKKSNRTHKTLGYTPNQLLEHLQTFPEWGNLKHKNWHLDHVFPIIAFVQNGIEDISLICCLDNLQPLSGTENCSKNDKYDQSEFEEWLKGRGVVCG